jgi:uncharacterized membrane protein (UPF0127 family)
MKRFRMMVMAAMGLASAPAWAQMAEPTQAQPKLPTTKIVIQGHGGPPHVFQAELASTPREQEVGEMYRMNIPADSGMFFDWKFPHEQAMWMKNCPVPEDMVFIGQDGLITHIAENTVPYSEANISSGGPVRATLELQGGITEKLDIRVGDRVTGAIFTKSGG